MNQCSLHFDSVTEISQFIEATRLCNFLLLGKKAVLVANYSDTAMRIAKEDFNAKMVEDPEIRQVSNLYFNQPACLAS